jgi:hypothetical protein
MSRRMNLRGRKFGRLTVVGRAPDLDHNARWWCRCTCGSLRTFFQGNLVRSLSRSCGCLKKELAGTHCVTHGRTGTKMYRIWGDMWARVRGSAKNCRHRYFGRITCCKRWLKFENFLADMGERPVGMTLGRIDNDGPYSPKNCRWETPKQQARNRRTSRTFTFNGVTATIAEWGDRLASRGLNQFVILYRIRAGWSPEAVVNTPLRVRMRRVS